jgi:type IV secretory pathway VirB10-like protein
LEKEGFCMLKVRKPSTGRGALADSDPTMGSATDFDAVLEVAGDADSGADDTRGLPADAEGTADYTELGEHVASVLHAANEAAARIRQEAEEDAERIADASRKEAMATLSEANRDADKLLFEADQRRAEADEAAKATRTAADAYADQQRREGHAEASRLIAEADQEAARRAHAAADRYQTLRDNVARTEDRLDQLVAGLRELAARLDEVLRPDASNPGRPATDTAVAESAD